MLLLEFAGFCLLVTFSFSSQISRRLLLGNIITPLYFAVLIVFNHNARFGKVSARDALLRFRNIGAWISERLQKYESQLERETKDSNVPFEYSFPGGCQIPLEPGTTFFDHHSKKVSGSLESKDANHG